MTLFLPQHRVLLNETGAAPVAFPAPIVANLTLAPEDAFGVAGAEHRRVFAHGFDLTRWLNVNTGIAGGDGPLIDALHHNRSAQGAALELEGNRLVLRWDARSLENRLSMAGSASLVLPAALSLRMGLYVWIKEFLVDVGGASYRFGVATVPSTFHAVTSDWMVDKIDAALTDWFSFREGQERLISALHYYRHALRLYEVPLDPVTMTAEVMLNLTKALEVLMTSHRDTVRARARLWGISEQETEEWIIPLFLVRSQIDVAHPAFEPLNPEEREVVRAFAHQAVVRVGEILVRLVEATAAGQIEMEASTGSHAKERSDLFAALTRYVGLPSAAPGT